MQSLYQLTTENLRIENVWPLPNGECSMSMIEFMSDRQALPDVLNELLGWSEESPAWSADLFNGEGDDDCEEAWDELCYRIQKLNKSGFLAEVHRPVMTYRADGTCSFSWGRYRTIPLFGETIDKIVEQAIAWAKATDEAGFAKAREATDA
jgi:hypothetical protein